VSDIVGPEGVVNAVEFSPVAARGLIRLAETRPNIVPILADARHPHLYAPLIAGPIDVVYQDIAQPDQARILLRNIDQYCTIGVSALVAIKARSIDSVAPVSTVYEKEIAILRESGMEILQQVDLAPLEKDHIMLLLRVGSDVTWDRS